MDTNTTDRSPKDAFDLFNCNLCLQMCHFHADKSLTYSTTINHKHICQIVHNIDKTARLIFMLMKIPFLLEITQKSAF